MAGTPPRTGASSRMPAAQTARIAGHGLSAGLLAAAGGSFGLRVLGTGLGFTSAVIVAGLLGAGGYGIYVYVMALIGLLGVITGLGLDRLVIRELTGAIALGQWALASGLIRQVALLTVGASSVIAVVVGLAAFALSTGEGHLLPVLLIALPVLILNALARVRTGVLQALHHVVLSQVPEFLVRPGVLLALVAALFVLGMPSVAGPATIMIFTVIASGCAFVVGTVALARRLPPEIRSAQPAYDTRRWLRSAGPLLAMGLLTAVNQHADLLLLGTLAGPDSAGIYGVAQRIATLVAFALLAVNGWLAPAAAARWAHRDLDGLQRVAMAAAWTATGATLVLVIGVVLARQPLLAVFGDEFKGGETAVLILAGAQLISAIMGSVGVLLLITGHYRDILAGLALSASLNVGTSIALIPTLGVEGAAIGSATGVIVWNVLFSVVVYRRLGIHCTVVGPPIAAAAASLRRRSNRDAG